MLEKYDDFSVGDMALELADREYCSVPPAELMHTGRGPLGARESMAGIMIRAREVIIQQWLQKAEQNPEWVRNQYESMTAGSTDI